MALRTARTSIYIDAVKFFNLIYEGQFEMDKRDRIVLANRLLDHTEQFIAFFSLTYNTEKKAENVDKMFSEFECIKFLCRFAIENHKFKKQTTINSITESIVKMDEGIIKWRNYIYSASQV